MQIEDVAASIHQRAGGDTRRAIGQGNHGLLLAKADDLAVPAETVGGVDFAGRTDRRAAAHGAGNRTIKTDHATCP